MVKQTAGHEDLVCGAYPWRLIILGPEASFEFGRGAIAGGILSIALQVLAVMRQTGRSLAELAAGMTKLPQVMVNVKVGKRFDPYGVPAAFDAPRARR